MKGKTAVKNKHDGLNCFEKSLCLKQRIPTSKIVVFSFPQKSGLYETYMVLCPAAGGKKK